MGGNYEKGMYHQLMDVMARLDAMETEHRKDRKEISGLTAEVESLRKENTRFRAELAQVKEENAGLRNENSALRAENQMLRNDNERMKRILNNDSANSSLPPSSDQPGKAPNTYNSRKPSNRKKGGQPGHKGAGLTRKEVEERIRQGKFQHRIEEIGTPSSKYITRYRLDLDVRAIATEIRIYQNQDGKYPVPEELTAEVSYGPAIKSMASCLYSEGIVSNDRICEFINSISGDALSLSEGTVYHSCRKFSELCRGSMGAIEQDLLNTRVLCTDATPVTIDGILAYIRNISSPRSVLYIAALKKKLEEMKQMRVLPEFTGILEHDHETALYHFGTGHGECNVHVCRYLKKNTEETGNSWSKDMAWFLTGMNHARERKKAEGKYCFTLEEIEKYEGRYEEILLKGESQSQKTKGKYARKEEGKLLRRLRKYKENHLLFLKDFEVPFSDNMSERDLRKCKGRQKMAGGFRSKEGMDMYCTILSFVETVKRRGLNVYQSIISMFEGKPVII